MVFGEETGHIVGITVLSSLWGQPGKVSLRRGPMCRPLGKDKGREGVPHYLGDKPSLVSLGPKEKLEARKLLGS